MIRRPVTYTPLAIALQTASLLVVAGCVLGILFSDINRQKSALTNLEGSTHTQFE